MNKKFPAIIVIIFMCLIIGSTFMFSGSEDPQTPPEKIAPEEQISRAAEHPTKTKMVPHKALYDISMISSSSGSQIVNITGNMYFEWKPTCDAWTTDHRFNLTYEYTDSPAMQITSDFTTWEAQDGSSFNFTSRRSRDGEIYEEIRGVATRNEDGSGKAIYTMPEELSFDLPVGFVFPMQHTELMIEKIASNEGNFVNRVLFDGSDVDGPIEVNAFLGSKANAMARTDANAKIDVTLLNDKAKDVQMAFFPLNESDNSASDYEMKAVFHENSVISDMMIDYNEFSIRQSLVALETLDVKLECQ